LDSAPSQKDVVLAILGSAASLAGLVLVFLGVVIAAYQALPSNSSGQLPGQYRVAGTWTLSLFVFSLATVALALVWLLTEGENGTLYSVVAVTFVVQLVATAVVAAAITRALLKGFKWG
jgi:hypothetical protein